MRCKGCNVELNDAESTFKDQNGEFVDMCTECLTKSYDYDMDIDAADMFKPNPDETID